MQSTCCFESMTLIQGLAQVSPVCGLADLQKKMLDAHPVQQGGQ